MAESIKCLTCKHLNNCNEEPQVEEELEVSPHTDYSDENIIKEDERWEP